MPRDSRFKGFDDISDQQIEEIQQSSQIREDAVVVRTQIGGAVWIDPDDLATISDYRTGRLRGDENIDRGGIFYRTGPKIFKPDTTNTTILETPENQQKYSIPTAKFLQFRIVVHPKPVSRQLSITIRATVKPAVPVFAPGLVVEPTKLTIIPIPLEITDGTIVAVSKLIQGKINSYFDQDRIGKTVLNFGQDFQQLLTNWKYDLTDSEQKTISVKLYNPLPDDVELLTDVWISRELAPPLIDQVLVEFIPEDELKIYLRPPNTDLKVRNENGEQVYNATLQNLLTTGSFNVANYQDPILQEWFVTSLEGSELNVDYEDFRQFVFYSSAQQRLNAFKEKLILLEDYDSIIAEQSASIAAATIGVVSFTSSLAFDGFRRISEQRLDLIRSFDGYERFLYYGSGSAYSSSLTADESDQLYYLNDATWPKVNGQIISVASASSGNLYAVSTNNFSPIGDLSSPIAWFDAISFIASEYDSGNKNRLVNNLPEYLQNDEQSDTFIRFVDLIGHQFDILKMYADQMPKIYDRNNNPEKGLSPDLVWDVASSFGIDLPNQYAVKQLVDYTIGEIGVVSPTVYRQTAAETWKRFLHNQIYLLKTKGTKNALRGLLNAYGVLPTTIQIRESSTPSFYITQSYELIEEQTNTLDLVSGSFVSIPFSGSGARLASTIQTRFATTFATQSVLFNIENQWGVRLVPITGSYGRVVVVSGSTAVASSSAYEIYSGDYYSVTVQRSGNQVLLWTLRADEDGDIVESSTATGSLGNWFSGSTLYLGSSGSSLGTSFDGNIDEFRMWSESLSDNTIRFHAKYPALYNGNTTTSARDNLLVRFSFGVPKNLGGASPFVINESPFVRQTSASALYTQFSASGFPNEATYPYSMEVVTRNVLRFTPNTGGSQYSSNKIVVVDPPVLRYLSDDSGSGVPVLSHEQSIVSLDSKLDKVRGNNVVGFYFSLTDAINDSIIRTIGNVDLQDYIGNPADLYETTYSDLDELKQLYWANYAYSYNYNSFLEFVENLLQPLFVQAKKLVPAKTKLLSGIVLESPILERNKIKWSPIDTSGIGTFEENSNPTLFAEPVSTQPESAGSLHLYEVTIDNTESPVQGDLILEDVHIEQEGSDVQSSMMILEDIVDIDEESPISAIMPFYEGTTEQLHDNTLVMEFITIDDETAKLAYLQALLQRFNISSIAQLSTTNRPYFYQLLTTFSPGSRFTVGTGFNSDAGQNEFTDVITPYVDFFNIESIYYFLRLNGVVPLVTEREVRVNQNILVSAGTWTKGSTYVKNQYVLQTGQEGDAIDGNGYEFVCVTPLSDTGFLSNNPPSLDFENWRKVQYKNVSALDIKTATVIDDELQLASPTGGYTPFSGYRRKHYKFHRDTRLGTIRHQWIGCVQSDDTTFDGRPAVEVISSAGDILVVSSGQEPVQRSTDTSGPILNVE